MRELRQDQSEAMDSLRDAIGMGSRRIVMQAPTGFGKTVLAAGIVHNAREKKKRVLFTVPALALIDQTVEMFYEQSINVGVIQANHHLTDWSLPVQVASVQTLQRREKLPEADLVLIDECHRWFTFYGKWLRNPKWQAVPMIGLSATPWTKGLGAYYDRLIVASTTEELIKAGLLSDFKVYAPTHPDLSDIRTVAGDYHEGQLSARMSETKLVADAVDTWLKLAEGRPTLCYAVDRAHAKQLQEKFKAAGVECAYQDAFTNTHERKAIKAAFHAGVIKVVCNVGTLTTGIDWDVRCISMCRPTKSDMLFAQIVGRGLRTAKGKDHCLILDHSDNHLRLGMVTDIDQSYTGMHDGKKAPHANRMEGIRLPKECPNCAFLKPPRAAKCPVCAFVVEAHSNIKPLAGELRELKRTPKPKTAEIDKRTFFAELKAYGELRGYKAGWAANQYRERMHVWPSHDIRDVPPAGTISRETRGWITSRMIAYHKGRANGVVHHARHDDRGS
jgi:superfamily II DNA or RNA helicase